MMRNWEKGCKYLCAFFGGLFSGGMLCRLFLTSGDAYAPQFPAEWMIFAVCFFLLAGFVSFRILRKFGATVFAVLIPLLWLTPLFLPSPVPEMLTAFCLGGSLAFLGQLEKTALTRLLLLGAAAGFLLSGWNPALCGRIVLFGAVAAALCGIIRIAFQTELKFRRGLLILLVGGSAAALCRWDGDAIVRSTLPPPPLFAASLLPTVENKVDVLFVSDRFPADANPLDTLPYVGTCSILSWREFAALCTAGTSAEYDLVALDAAPGRSGAYKCEALHQGLLRTRKNGGVFLYPGNGAATPCPAGASTAVSLPWDDNCYFAATRDAEIPGDPEKMDDRLQLYQNTFGFELFPAGVFTAIYHSTRPQFVLPPPPVKNVRPLPPVWWKIAAIAAVCYYLLRLLLCRRERFGAVFAAQENAVSFGLVLFAGILQGINDFFSPVPAICLFGFALLPLLAFRMPAQLGVCMLTAGWIFPACWLFPACAGDWKFTVPAVIFCALGAEYSCFRQNRPGWIPAGSVTGQYLTGMLIAALLAAGLHSLQLPLLPLAAACLILRTGVTLRS